jgi:hypothetical protein
MKEMPQVRKIAVTSQNIGELVKSLTGLYQSKSYAGFRKPPISALPLTEFECVKQ